MPLTRQAHVSAIAVCVGLSSSIAHGGGTKGSLALIAGSYATGVSDDGSIVVLNDALQYWYWTASTGHVPIGGIAPGYQGAGGSGGISADGSRIGFTAINPKTGKTEAAIYEVATGETTLIGNFGASCDIGATSAWGISGDGTHVVGLGQQAACSAIGYVWNATTGLVSLPSSYFYKPNRANGCSFDGSTVVGWQSNYVGEWLGCIWRNGVQTIISGPGNLRVGDANACSADGQWVVGLGRSTEDPAWRWRQSTGYSALPLSPISGYQSYAVDVSNDGSRVAMFFRAGPPATSGEGYLWIDGTLHELEEYARAQGVDVPNDVRLSLPLAMSGDGYTIVGTGRTAFGNRIFVLNLPRPASSCPTDIDGNGETGAPDLSLLLAAWGTSGAADVDGDGAVGAADLSLLLAAWGACS
jgi:uncharacterized membrane protein